jgi:hypothetical protein
MGVLILSTTFGGNISHSKKKRPRYKKKFIGLHVGTLVLSYINGGPGSSVGIATDYGLDGPGIEPPLLALVEREGCAVKQ